MLGAETGKAIHLDWQFPDKGQDQLKRQTVATSLVKENSRGDAVALVTFSLHFEITLSLIR